MNTNFYKKTLSWLCALTALCFSSGLQAQDSCPTALPLTVAVGCNDFVNTAAFPGTTSAEACEAGQDAIWYSFVAPVSGVVDVTSTMSAGLPDTDLSIVDACGAAACLAQDDDGGDGFTSAAMGTPVTAGSTYYVQWGDRWGDVPAEWAIRVVPGDPTNPPIIGVGAVGETTAEITPDATPCGAAGFVEYGAPGFDWGTGTDVAGTSITGLTPGTTYEVCISCVETLTPLCEFGGAPWAGITSGPQSTEVVVCESFTTPTPCPDPADLVCAPGAAAGELVVTWTADPLHTGTILEWGPVGFAPGAGTVVDPATSPYTITGVACDEIDVYLVGVCADGNSLPVGPTTCSNTIPGPGDTCGECTPLTLTPDPAACAAGGVYPATFTFVAPNLGCGGASAAAGEGCWTTGATSAQWYCFTPACNMTATLTSAVDPASTDTRLALYSGTCDALVCEAQDDDGGGVGFTSAITSFDFTAGTPYVIEWDDRWSGNGFEWDIIVESEDAACAMPLCIPTAGQWGLICLSMSFLILGLVWMREDKTVFVTQ